jgi:hypothetical protein
VTGPSQTTKAGNRELLAKLAAMHEACDPYEPWSIEREPHNHADGTTHFHHVVARGRDVEGSPVNVMIAGYLSPELAEFMVNYRNNFAELVRLARLGVEIDG